MSINQQLYRPYDPGKLYPDLFRFDAADKPLRVRLRPFYIPEDFHLYNEWINQVLYPDKQASYPPVSSFTASYFTAILESQNAQSIWGLIDDEPAFSMEIYEAVDYPIDFGSDIRIARGDIILELIINPALVNDRERVHYILPACLAYLKKFAGSAKIVWLIDEEDQEYQQLARAAQPAFYVVIRNKQLWIF